MCRANAPWRVHTGLRRSSGGDELRDAQHYVGRETRHARRHAVWPRLPASQRRQKSPEMTEARVLVTIRGSQLPGDAREPLGAGMFCHLGLGGGCPCAYVYKTSLSCTFNICAL